MPELPEVQRVVDTLWGAVVGAVIRDVDVRRADVIRPCGFELRPRLAGAKIAALDRRGKRIVFMLGTGDRFYVHLGMTGRLTTAAPHDPIEAHTHVVFHIVRPPSRGVVELRFRDPRRFGGIFWLGSEPDAGTMGPEPLTLSSKALAKILGRTGRAIKVALLDQRLVAGLGNIYVDESLFDAGIDPLKPANGLSESQTGRLSRSIKRVLRRAIRHGGSTLRDYVDAEGKPGAFQRLHRVYDRAGDPCRACKTPIARIVLGGRSTHFCPRCQS